MTEQRARLFERDDISAGRPVGAQDAREALVAALALVGRPGDFAARGRIVSPLPSLVVAGIGRLSLPLPAAQAEALIALAERAPYGRGDATLVDTNVRRSWQIAPDQVAIEDGVWQRSLRSIVKKAARRLGADGKIRAELYKLLVYEEGGFFVAHRDTEKSPGMFATLIVALPSAHEGGELVVHHAGRELVLDLRTRSLSRVSFGAFYADCLHELRPVTTGYRVCLIYNLIRSAGRIDPPESRPAEEAAARVLTRWAAEGAPTKILHVLEHHYTPASLSWSALKNRDLAVAGALMKAARAAGVSASLAMVSIEESGTAEHVYSGRGRRGRFGDEDPSEFEVDEVCERAQRVTQLLGADGTPSPLAELPFEQDEVSPPGCLDDEPFDEVHFSEATGNEGASFERTYRRAGVVLWPEQRLYAVLAQLPVEVAVPALVDQIDRGASDAPRLAAELLERWPRYTPAPVRAAMLAALARLGRLEHITAFFEIAIAGYDGRENDAIVAACDLLGAELAEPLLVRFFAANMPRSPGACVKLLAGSSRTMRSAAVVAAAVSALPADERNARLEPMAVASLVQELESIDPVQALAAVRHMLAYPVVYELDRVIVPAALLLGEPAGTGGSMLRSAARVHLVERVARPLEPPKDWARAAELRCACKDCKEASRFLADRTTATWAFKAVEQRRRHLESKLGASDVVLTTLRGTSPLTLKVTKNTKSHDARVAERARDTEHLARITAQSLR